jgi:hypothetical protein
VAGERDRDMFSTLWVGTVTMMTLFCRKELAEISFCKVYFVIEEGYKKYN